jgi:phosphoglycolate phosphatase
MKKYTHLIWDFNGTLLDDVALSMECTNRMLRERGLPVIPDLDAHRDRNQFPIIESYRALGFDFEKEDYYTVLAPQWVEMYLEGEHLCDTMPGVRETLERVREMGIPQLILSASHIEMLTGQLDRLGIAEYFSEILGLGDIYAGGKTELAIAWRRRNPDAVPLFVGDTHHDAESAEAMGADCVLYVGGHQSKKRLSEHGKPLIDDIADIVRYLES